MSGVVWELIPWNEDEKVIVLFVCRRDQGNSDTQAIGVEAEESDWAEFQLGSWS